MENNKTILDSNILFALYSKNDALNEKAVFLMKELWGSWFLLPYSVIQEVSTLMAYRFGKKESDGFLKDLKNASDIIFIENDLTGEMDFYLKCEQKMSFTDVGLIYLAKKHNALLFTFDKQLLNLSKKHL